MGGLLQQASFTHHMCAINNSPHHMHNNEQVAAAMSVPPTIAMNAPMNASWNGNSNGLMESFAQYPNSNNTVSSSSTSSSSSSHLPQLPAIPMLGMNGNIPSTFDQQQMNNQMSSSTCTNGNAGGMAYFDPNSFQMM